MQMCGIQRSTFPIINLRLHRDRHGGGIAFYIANHLSHSVVCSDPNNLELLAISISLRCSNVGMALLYRPPSPPVSYLDSLSTALENLCIPLFSKFLLIGDCNVDISLPTTLCHQLFYITNQHGLSAIRTDHTHVTDSKMTTIDLAFTKSCDIFPPLGTSDCYELLATFSLYPGSLNSLSLGRYKHADFELANNLLSQVKPSTVAINDSHNINESWEKWNSEFLRIMEQCIPHGTLPKRKNLP